MRLNLNIKVSWSLPIPATAHHARRCQAHFLQVLKRLHKGDGGQTGWTLLTDAFAGSLVFLTLSGILLWTRLDGGKLLAAGLAFGGAPGGPAGGNARLVEL